VSSDDFDTWCQAEDCRRITRHNSLAENGFPKGRNPWRPEGQGRLPPKSPFFLTPGVELKVELARWLIGLFLYSHKRAVKIRAN